MKAARIHSFGGPEVIVVEDVPRPVPVVAITAWQMLFDYGKAEPGQTVLILGAAGNVGAYAVQFAANADLHVISVVGSKDIEYARTLGSETVLAYQAGRFEDAVHSVDLA